MVEQHPDFEFEKEHLETTISQMHHLVDDLNSDIADRSLRIRNSASIKDQISVYVHTILSSDNAVKIQNIEAAIPNPYFGRVDFREDGAEEFNRFYIGRCKVAKLKTESLKDFLVFDWRDPVSIIFYECHNGRAEYEVMNRYRYSGDVSLKRQFKIEDCALKAIVDNFILNKILENQQSGLLADPLLLDRLQQGATDKLKDIITSIQSEQNKIIREPLNQVTIIQGVAGSGKTTVGLHRLSYLLYNDKLDPKKLIIIAPNPIFLNYISELLPEIDAADVQQMVWDGLIMMITGAEHKITEESRLDLILSGNDKDYISLLKDTARLKGSLAFLQILDTYIQRRIQKFCQKLNDIELFAGQLRISTKEQIDKFVEDVTVPYNQRLRHLIRYLTFRVNNYLEVMEAKKTNSSKTEEQLNQFRKEADAFISNHFKQWTPLPLMDSYRQLFSDKPAFKPAKDLKYDLDAIRSHSISILNTGQADREDLAPLAYLKYLLDGWAHIPKFTHIMIDEAQDLSALEFAILKKLSGNGSFTIMGDLSQGIHSYRSISSWNVLFKEVFGDARVIYREILYSYRSAKEIIDVFNRVMPQGNTKAIPVYEIGRKPTIEKIHSADQGVASTVKMLNIFKDRGAKSVGIITKLEKEAVTLHGQLLLAAMAAGVDCSIHLITGKSTSYHGGISILPVSSAKGLEFDGVIIWNASDAEFTTDPLDAQLLYVALSRAMHSLHIMYQGELTPLLKRRKKAP
ncbi:MAG: UvrD-helicase domain-containing protein [Negativicutes bacterium]|nr:UvrD-helicase domain-containing protein [Negativicutes bacterium]